ncbi:Fc.00g088120.m01.CDS01 [Cosmosporella sp. VM-42]
MAARRVAEENRQLRGLLNRHGINDDYITSYLHSGTVAQPDPIPVSHYATGNPGETVQSLQHTIAPRRPTAVDTNVPYPVPQEGSREASIASVSTSSSSVWEPTQPMQPNYGRGLSANVPQQMGRQPMFPQTAPHPFPQVSTISITPRTEEYRPQPNPYGAMMEEHRHTSSPFPVVSLSTDVHSNMAYNPSLNPFHTQTGPDPGPPGC